MLKELLVQLWTNVHSIEHASIRLYESDALSLDETILIKNGLYLWCGITLEKASAVLSESDFAKFGGRLLLQPAIILGRKEGFSSFLSLLDEVDDIITSIISSDSSRFKAETLRKELRCCLVRWSPDLWRTLSPLISSLTKDELSVDDVRFLRQLSNLLSKIHIDRSDLLADSYSEYLYSEELSFAECSVQECKSNEYWDLILRIRLVLKDVIKSFNMIDCVPKHGPGAVADPKVKTRLDKYLNLGFDSRIDYMLRHGTGEDMSIYSPFPLKDQDRTSRVVFVPKTWKKLRGISAEPAGLQFFQQAVLGKLIEAIDSTPLRFVINLQDQGASRTMALKGSRDGSLATIDLSSASDSVTLQIVKDVFGSSDLCRWLLATRSTHTLLGQESLKIFKFAPMGSACCFPVECLLFAGIALASAAKHHGSSSVNYRDFRVYGDDIICPSAFAHDIMDDLVLMGFSVNTDKSYHSGDYRESCGMDAWCGMDVTPLKIKDFSFNFDGSVPLSYEHHSRITAYLSRLYLDGYHQVRSFLLRKFLYQKIVAKGQRFRVQRSLVFGDGSRGTIASCQPDNFHLEAVPLKGLQRSGFQLLVWKPRARRLSVKDELLLSEVNYFERMISRRGSCLDDTCSYDLEFFMGLAREASPTNYTSIQMVPTLSVHDTWQPTILSRFSRERGFVAVSGLPGARLSRAAASRLTSVG